jgi:hypothetical protein
MKLNAPSGSHSLSHLGLINNNTNATHDYGGYLQARKQANSGILLLLSAAFKESQILLHRQHAQPSASSWAAQWLKQGWRKADIDAGKAAVGDDLHRDRLSVKVCGIAIRMGVAEHTRDTPH